MAAIDETFSQWLSQQQSNWSIQGIGSVDTGTVDALQRYWEGLDEGQKTAFFAQLQTQAKTPEQLIQIAKAPQSVTASTAPTPPTATTENISPSGAVSSTAVGTGTPVEGSSQASALINQYMTTPQWQGDPNDPQGAAEALGVDFTSADQQYQQYQNSWQQAYKRFSPGIAGGTLGGQQPMAETQFIQSLAQSQYGQWGPVIGMLAYAWQEQNGSALPPQLAQQIVAGLKAIPANDAAQLQTQMLNSIEQISHAAAQTTGVGGQATNLNLDVEISSFLGQLSTYAPAVYSGTGSSSGAAGLAQGGNSIVGRWNTANPNAAAAAATTQGSERTAAISFLSAQGLPLSDANIAALSNPQTLSNMGAYVSWMQGVGMPITPTILTQLMTMPFGNPNTATVTAGTGGAFLLDQAVPGTHMTYGAQQQIAGQVTPLWSEYFNGTPKASQLAYFVGKSPQEITDYFNKSMSSMPGVTIGQKNDYLSFIQQLDSGYGSPSVGGITHVFSSQIDDSMMNQLHQQVTAQSTGKPTPAPMK